MMTMSFLSKFKLYGGSKTFYVPVEATDTDVMEAMEAHHMLVYGAHY